MEKKIYEAEMFIIPNGIRTERGHKSCEDMFWKSIDKKMEIYFGEKAMKKNHGSRRMVQIWITSSESDNWADKKCPIDGGYFIPNLPTWMIGKMKEGDTIEVDLPNHGAVLRLTAAQKKYRYERFGNFEDVLKQLGV